MGGAALATALVVWWIVATGRPGHPPEPAQGAVTVQQNPAPERDTSPTGTPPIQTSLTDELARLADTPAILPAPSGRIVGAATAHPDLYAAAFVEALLTQDYAQQRNAKLAWVQAESTATTEPLVVGLVPVELRSKMAVFSVTDTVNGTALIPTASGWEDLRSKHGHATVRIDRVSEPLAWSNAVLGGRITDPGISAREVAATVTLETNRATLRRSVALILHLEGPPVRREWRFVTVVDFRSLPMGES
ncbi:hypothetical protein ACOCJ5_07490 [Knoellia sp. CPCC 206450]|uniref:hypothetical protein n=1 Tax=Knoellia tibetensis TaxID=3404798 RepID=UPI003B43B40C